MPKTNDTARFRMLRYFSLMNLLCIIGAAALLVLLYRQIAIDTIVDLGERSNLALAQTALSTIRAPLVDYFDSVADTPPAEIKASPIDPELRKAIQELMRDTTVVRIKLYNRQGTVAFSTREEQIGRDQRRNPGFTSAMQGRVESKLVYRDTFNRFDEATEDDNLIQSYIPVRLSQAEPIQGVFEIYTDVNPLVKRTEYSEFVILIGVVGILLLLYSFLLFVVRRAERIIGRQESTIRERTKTLELLSAQMITAQEDEKKRIAGDLHEGIAQTLSGVKVHMEAACQRIEQSTCLEDVKPLEALVPHIQEAIQEVRAFAMALRPASLDDFGIIPTVSRLCREFGSIYTDLDVEVRIDLKEEEIPSLLKVVIYRIVQESVTDIGKAGDARSVHIDLAKADNRIVLTVEDDALAYYPAAPASEKCNMREVGLSMMKERTVLSGGIFSVNSNDRGRTVSRASWPC